jgi:ribonuclease-3
LVPDGKDNQLSKPNYAKLCQTLNYEFKDESLLLLALTHRSKGGIHNERLEFLGDSIVNCVIAEALFHRFPEASEGQLSRWRAVMVNRESLGDLGRHYDLGTYLSLGAGEIKSGGAQRHSILSCAMEAVIGAVYLDGGFVRVTEAILEWCEPLLSTLSAQESHKDPKTLLQEYVQGLRLPLPVYQIEGTEGQAHQQTFIIRCCIEGITQTSQGKGTSRRRAEQAAAEAMLEVLNQ